MNPEVTIIFACRKNAGRSQIAAAIARARAPRGIRVLSAGTEPAKDLHPQTYEVLEEIGLSPMAAPQRLTEEKVQGADWVITMGCGETCPFVPGVHYEDWPIADPNGQPLEVVREIREQISQRVDDLLARISNKTSSINR